MPGRVSSPDGSLSVTGTDQHYVPLDQTSMLSSCPLFKAGVVCCLPTCAQGLSAPVMGNSGEWHFFGFSGFSSVSCVLGER